MIGGRVLDLSALLSFAEQSSVYAAALVWTAVEEDIVLLAPSSAISLAWSRLDPATEPVLEVLVGLPNVVVDDLTRARSREIGEWLRGQTARLDIAHAAVCAVQRGWPIVTAEPTAYVGAPTDLVIEPLL